MLLPSSNYSGESMTRKPRKWNIPLTYEPKIEAVRSGKCRQTIRIDVPEPNEFKYHEGDQVSFHGWEGKPYRSQWSFRTPYFSLTHVINCMLYPWGLRVSSEFKWDDETMDDLARWDGIDPPTGIELKKVLESYHKIPKDGIKAQILRW